MVSVGHGIRHSNPNPEYLERGSQSFWMHFVGSVRHERFEAPGDIVPRKPMA